MFVYFFKKKKESTEIVLNRVTSMKRIGKIHNRESVGYSEGANNIIGLYMGRDSIYPKQYHIDF